MSGTTTELALSTAVDTDDTADYLTLSLANSLRTLDALFNNVSGHTHASAHQGGPISVASLRGAADLPDWFRSTGRTSPFASTGVGIELYWSGTNGVLQSYNRATAAYAETMVAGSKITLGINGANSLVIDGSQNVTMAAAATVTGALTASSTVSVGGALTVTGQTNLNGNVGVTGTLITADVHVYGGTYAIAFVDGSHYLQARPAGQTDTLAWTHDFSVARNLSVGGQASVTTSVTAGTTFNFTTDGQVYLSRYNDATVGTVIRANAANGMQALQFVPFNATGYFAVSNRSGAPTNELKAESHLYVPGSVWCTNVQQLSSEYLKSNIVNLTPTEALSLVLDPQVDPFRYTLDTPPPTGGGQMQPENFGFGANAMSLVCPEVVALGTVNGTPNSPMAIDYPSLVPVLWGAVRALDARLKVLEAA